ncbi:glycine betaine ABC transporter substrate-binding protein [Martelella mediterranea]|uniref:Glycine betaine/proline transport system substrate-binding protein n=1 Tax=Martelella mediterranea TaxID=293089 RepID=A0A4R3P1Q5_9HYPH|nr:glycine betaine ABC transporter substrate-binding protein [Martelella mediterranea]TCT40324.1 glycine betaine/proline transport system substrate-binding protein [Martelella mediterranea]
MKVTITAAAIAGALISSASFAVAAEPCGEISIAELNWPSAGIAAWVDRIILEEGYGCTVDLLSGDTVSAIDTITSAGRPDIIPEFWFESTTPALQDAVAAGKVSFAAPLLREGGVQGWWVPKYLVDQNPEITTVEAALAHPELFPSPADATVGAIFSCPDGWVCRDATENLFRAFSAEDAGFRLIDPSSSAALKQSIVDAFEKQQGWLGYYWAPTALLGDYDMVKLSFGVEFDKTEWDRCTVQPDCSDPKPNAYPVSAVYTLVTDALEEGHPDLMGYLGVRTWDNKTVSTVLAWQQENNATNAEAARYFLKEFPNVWHAWLPAFAADKVERTL